MNSAGLLAIHQLSPLQIDNILNTAKTYKQRPEKWENALEKKQIALLFEKPSLRTRVSFSAGLSRMGASVHYLDYQQEKLGQRETLKDLAKNLSGYLDALVVRTDSFETISTLARYSEIPVFNALCDHHHPCQALADLLTLCEKESEQERLHMAYVGEGNNVCHSLMEIFALAGRQLSVVVPETGKPDKTITRWCLEKSGETGATLSIKHDFSTLGKVDVIYTDTWYSMGSKSDPEKVRKIYRPFQVDDEKMLNTGARWFMHCQPVHRGEEVTDSVVDGPSSLVYQQAENRLHAQNALFLECFSKGV